MPLFIRADSINEKTRTIEAELLRLGQSAETWDSCGGRLMDQVLSPGGGKWPDTLPLLALHRRDDLSHVLGSVDGVRREGDTIVCRLRFAQDDPAADRAWRLVARGHLTAIEAAVIVEEATDLRPGQTATVGGRSYTAGGRVLRIATRWAIKEVSLVPVGSDAAGHVREANSLSHISGTESMIRTLPSATNPTAAAIENAMRHSPNFNWCDAATIALARRGIDAIPLDSAETLRSAFEVAAFGEALGAIAVSRIDRGFADAMQQVAWCFQMSLDNFRERRLIALKAMRLAPLLRDRAAEAAETAALAGSIRMARFAKGIEIDEQDLADGEAIDPTFMAAEELGRAAGRTVADLVFAELLSPPAGFFDASHGNVGAAPLATESLDAAFAAVANQADYGADDDDGSPIPLGQRPKFLIVPPELGGLARRLARAIALGDDADLAVISAAHLSLGVPDPRDDDALLAGSPTRWFLAAEGAPHIVLAGRGGPPTPKTRITNLTQGRWGVRIDVNLDAAAAALSPQGVFRATPA